MGSFSTFRALVHWQGLLLAVSLLNFWSLPTSAQFAIVSTNAAEGKDASLLLRNTPPDAIGFVWYRGEGAKSYRRIVTSSKILRVVAKGPTYSGREKLFYDGSLLITKVSMKDTGMYTVVAYLQNSKKEIGFGRLNVYPTVTEPIIIASSNSVTENKDTVVLTCLTNGISIQWWFNGWNLQLKERMKLSQDQRNLTINPVKREDAGYYRCKGSNPISSVISWPLELHVKYE